MKMVTCEGELERWSPACDVANRYRPEQRRQIHRWHRELVAKKFDSSGKRKSGRPRK